jgi:tRNA(Arg) A34 adenosine deaminase TadA
MKEHEKFMMRAIALAAEGMNSNQGGPFGAVVVKDGKIIAEGFNQVASSNDPTAHAEVVAIRRACSILEHFELADCTIYTSCEPCPMCLGAIYWSRFKAVYYGCNKSDAKDIEFDDQLIYDELEVDISKRKIPFINIMREEALVVFSDWSQKVDKVVY